MVLVWSKDQLVSICKNGCTKCLNISSTRCIDILGPKNGSFAVET